jgi:tetratricopeptide (TPR) repeat protein
VLDYLLQAETIARTLGDQVRLGELTVSMSVASQWGGEYDRALEYAERALDIARSLGSLSLQVEATSRLGQAYLYLGRYGQVSDVLRQNLAILQGDLRRERFGQIGYPVVTCGAFIVQALAERGEFAEAVHLADDVIHQADAFDQPWSLYHAYWSVGYLYLRAGRLETAIPYLQRAVAVCETAHIAFLAPSAAALLGYAYALARRSGEAVSLLEQAVDQADTEMIWIWQALCRAWLSEAYLLAGRRSDARDLAARALALAGKHKEQGGEAWTLRLLGEIAAQAEHPESENAQGYYRQARNLAEELGMRPLVAHCHLGLGTLYGKIGRHEQARVELATAAEMYRAMEMTFWLARAEADLRA